MRASGRVILAAASLAVTLLLTGCASGEVNGSSSAGAQSQNAQASFQDQLTFSHEKFTTEGGSEYVVSGGDNYILTYQPTSDGYSAALYNESFDDVIGIDEPLMVTLNLAKTMLDDPSTNVVETADGLELRSEQYGAIGLHFENGLVTSYEALEDTWHGTISYEVDQKVVDLWAAKLAEEQG